MRIESLVKFNEIIHGTFFGMQIMPSSYVPCSIFILAPGAFFVYAGLTALQNKLKMPKVKKNEASEIAMNAAADGEAAK